MPGALFFPFGAIRNGGGFAFTMARFRPVIAGAAKASERSPSNE